LNNEIEAVKEKHLLVAHNLTGDLTRYIIDVESSFRLIATNLAGNNKLEGVVAHIDSLFIRYIKIVNDDGYIINSVNSSKNDNKYINSDIVAALRPILEKSKKHPHDVFYSDMMRDENNAATFFLIKSIDSNRYAIASLTTEHVITAQQKVIFGKRGHAAIVDKTGRVIAHPVKNWVSTMKDLSAIEPIKKMMQGQTGVSQFYSPAMKEIMVAGYTVVPTVGWGVMIPQPYAELEERTAEIRFVAFIITILGIAIAGAIGWILAGILSRPIQSIVDSIKLKSTEQNLSKAITQHRFIPFELKELLASFNHMVDVIKTKNNSMEESENRLSEAQRIAHIGNWEWNITQDAVWCSDEFYRICKISPVEFKNNFKSFLKLIHPDDKKMVLTTLKQIQKNGGRFKLNHKINLQGKEDCYVHQEGELILDNNGQACKMIGIIHDITDIKLHEHELQYHATYDELTNLPNRTLFIERLKQETRRSARNNKTLGLLSIDLDNFKIVNDSYGHVIGDKLLQQAAIRLQSCIRESDTLARLGGDEFCIILCDINNEDDCSLVASKINSSFKNAFLIDEHESFTGASIGITLFPNDNDDVNTLIRNADIALYRAKESEQNTFCFFKEEMDKEVTYRMSMCNDLRKAVERDEFTLYYQPIIDLHTGQISSAEALIRWIHPQRGFISPDEFITLAETNGVIAPMGEWVLQTACSTAASWSQIVANPPRVSVNLSVRQLQLGLTKEKVEAIITSTNLDATQLIFEITESLVINDTEKAIDWMKSIRQLGITFSIDDFGTGYSSLSYLKKLPVDILKIDREFINDVISDPESSSLVKTIIAIGKNLNLKIVAEGVEHEDQLNHLRSLECDFIQGYYFSKPLPVEEFDKLLATWNFNKNKKNINS
jgi:diguanylate cyclase (GGDEF)-like protein